MKLGGLAPDDPRFSAAEKQRAAAIAVDQDVRKQFLVTLDLFGHREEDASTISIELSGAYKTGKQFNIDFSSPPAAINAYEQAIYVWLA